MQVAGKGTAKVHKMDVIALDQYGNIIKKLAVIKRDPETDVFQVYLVIEIQCLLKDSVDLSGNSAGIYLE